MFTLSQAIEAYRTIANADGKSARTVEWVTTVSARFGKFLGGDPDNCFSRNKKILVVENYYNKDCQP